MAGQLAHVVSALLANYTTNFELPQLVMECGPSDGCSGSAATDVKLIPALDFQASTLPLLLAYLSREVFLGVKLHVPPLEDANTRPSQLCASQP